jgi:TIR domain
MKVFISWSGDSSRRVAVALAKWLPDVLQDVESWFSAEAIGPGARWLSDIATQLEDTDFGVLCLTRENVNAPWINFEAGALAKSVQGSRVVPLLIGLNESDIPMGPLAQFQAILPTEDGIRRLVQSINELGGGLSAERLDRTVQRWWPMFQEELNEIQNQLIESGERTEPQRDSADMLAELLELTRGLQRDLQVVQSGSQREIGTGSDILRIPATSGMTSDLYSALVSWAEARGQKRSAVEVNHSTYGQGRILDVLQGIEGTTRLRVRFDSGTKIVYPQQVKLTKA